MDSTAARPSPVGQAITARLRQAGPSPVAALRWLRHAPLLAQLVVTRRCNLACGYCNEFDDRSAPVPLQTLCARVDRLARLGTLSLELTGGEPLLHPQIVDLVRHAATHRWAMLGMISNAYLLRPETVEALNEAGLTELQVSVDGVHPNETTVKVLRPLRRKLELLAARARFQVVLSGVVGAGAPMDEVLQVVRFARDHGFRPRVLLVHGADGQLRLGAEERRAFARVQRAIGWHPRDFFDYRRRLLRGQPAPFRCRAGSRYLYVDEHGVARWCSQTASRFGLPLEDYTAEELRRQYHAAKGCDAYCTIGCARTCSMADRFFPQRGRG